MRIGFNGRFLAAPAAGVQRVARELLVHMADRAELVVLLPRNAPEPPVSATGARIPFVRGRSAGWLWEQGELPQLAETHCDVLLHPANSGCTARVPHVLVLHDVLPLTNPAWFGAPFALWYRVLIPRLARSAARIVTFTDSTRREIIRTARVAPGRVMMAQQGVAPFSGPADAHTVQCVRERFDLTQPFVLAVGSDRRKNIGFILDVMAEWHHDDPAAPTLVVVGGSVRRVHGAPAALPPTNGVRLLGRVSDEELHALYTAADALCCPSLAEGFGRPPLEAAACGTPAVVAPCPAAHEVLAGLRATRIVPLQKSAWREAVALAQRADAADLAADGELVRNRCNWDDAASSVLAAVHAARDTPRSARIRHLVEDMTASRVAIDHEDMTAPQVAIVHEDMTAPRVAIVHDWLTGMRGGERVLEELIRLYPQADVHTLLHVRGSTARMIEERVVATSFADRLPFAHQLHPFLLPLYPTAAEQLDLTGYDIVISSSHCVAKGVRATAPHLCYCHTPMRYIWDRAADYARASAANRAALTLLAPRLRAWDRRTAVAPDRIVANSRHVQQRIAHCWQRAADVVYPPVDVDRFAPARTRDEYFLYAGALVPYKRADLAVRAFTRLGRRLLVVGTGPEYARLRALAGPTIEFAGRLTDEQLADALAQARALVMPMVEDFGIIAVEAQAAGTPVLAFAGGGALETVRGWSPAAPDGATGIFFGEQSAASLADIIPLFDTLDFDTPALMAHARRFEPGVFRSQISAHVAALLER